MKTAMSKACCSSQEDTLFVETGPGNPAQAPGNAPKGEPQGHDHDHGKLGHGGVFRMFLPAMVSLVLLLLALAFDHLWPLDWFQGWPRILWYAMGYLPVGLPVIRDAIHSIRFQDFFSEFFLMSLATFGAFAIGEYPEAVAVMLFYSVGEAFQGLAVTRAKGNIKALLDQRPEEVTVLKANGPQRIKATEAKIGEVLELKAGEKLALDGELLSARGSFNSSALTGESRPDTKYRGEAVLAGMINGNAPVQVRVGAAFTDSKLSKILALVQEATAQKAPTELFIRKFAKVYTPFVVFLAVAIWLLPALFVEPYVFGDWLYRALIFLVISCPCALVISIPLGYFGGIGAGSRNGILFKGSNFLDLLAQVGTVVMDKTGTLTEGVFEVQEVRLKPGTDQESLLKLVKQLESHSNHPVALAIGEHLKGVGPWGPLEEIEELPGLGMVAKAAGKQLLAGNFKLLERYGVPVDRESDEPVATLVALALDGAYVGYMAIADRPKADARQTVGALQQMGVQVAMLSGDKRAVVRQVAGELGIDQWYGELLPQEKVQQYREIKKGGGTVAFVGDGVNDAAVIALSDVGIAMGGLGSDAAIETADVVIQDDLPSRIPMAIQIGKATKKIVWQNMLLAFGVKAAVLVLGAGGLAGMWEAVFADVGVALLAILNAVRIQRMDFRP